MYFWRLKIKRLASLTAPLSLNERSLGEAGEEQIKLALVVAHALTAAAADASITTAQVATEVVWFTSTPQSSHQCENEVEEFSVIRFQGEAPQSNHQCRTEIHKFASTRIQSAFQGYHVCLKSLSLFQISFLNSCLFSANLQMLETLYIYYKVMPKRKTYVRNLSAHKLN